MLLQKGKSQSLLGVISRSGAQEGIIPLQSRPAGWQHFGARCFKEKRADREASHREARNPAEAGFA